MLLPGPRLYTQVFTASFGLCCAVFLGARTPLPKVGPRGTVPAMWSTPQT